MKPEELSCKDLMVGDFIRRIYNQKIIKVIEIKQSCIYTNDNGYEYNEIEPIPITQEILEKNGFVHYEEDVESFHDKDCVFIKQNLGGYGVCLDKNRTLSGLLHYVHELQHALRLCGIDKEIIL